MAVYTPSVNLIYIKIILYNLKVFITVHNFTYSLQDNTIKYNQLLKYSTVLVKFKPFRMLVILYKVLYCKDALNLKLNLYMLRGNFVDCQFKPLMLVQNHSTEISITKRRTLIK